MNTVRFSDVKNMAIRSFFQFKGQEMTILQKENSYKICNEETVQSFIDQGFKVVDKVTSKYVYRS